MKWLCSNCGQLRIISFQCKPLQEYYPGKRIPDEYGVCDDCKKVDILHPYPVDDKDLKGIMKKIEKIIMDELDFTERPGVIMSIAVPGKKDILWCSNVSRKDGVAVLQNTLNQIKVNPTDHRMN